MDIFQTVVTAITLATKAKSYLEGVKVAPKERKELQNQCNDILTVLIGLQDLQRACKVSDPWYDCLAKIGRRDGPVDHLAGKLSALVDKTYSRSRHTWSKWRDNLAWPFSTDDILRLRREIDTILATINAELNIVHILIGHHTLQSRTQKIIVRQIGYDEDFDAHYRRLRDAHDKHIDGTGAWLWSSSEYKTWLEGSSPWINCTGVYGAGKTVLASAVFHDLIKRFHTRGVGVAYLFCGIDSMPAPNFTNYKAVLLRQLILQAPVVSQEIINAHERSTRYGSIPYSSTTIDKTLQLLCRSFNEVFVVVDGLYEFGDSRGVHRIGFLRYLEKLRTLSENRPHIFVTSFDNLQPEIEVGQPLHARVTYTDLQLVLKDVISDLSCDVQNEVIAAVSRGANGVFLVVDRFSNYLCPPSGTISDSSVRERLENLNQDLSKKSSKVGSLFTRLSEPVISGYDLALRAIKAQSEPARSIGKSLLVLMLHPMRPLTVREVIHAIRIGTKHDFSDISGVQQLLRTVGGLIEERKDGVLALEHQALHDFLVQPENAEFLDGHRALAETCIDAILSTDGLEFAEATGNYDQMRVVNEKYPFLTYAMAFWGFHVRNLGESAKDRLKGKVLSILRQKSLQDACAQALDGSKVDRVHAAFVSGGSAIHLAAAFDLTFVLQELLPREDSDHLDRFGNTPLHWAAQFGAMSAMKLLLDHFHARQITRRRHYPRESNYYEIGEEEHEDQGFLSKVLQNPQFRQLFGSGSTAREPSAATSKITHKNCKGRTVLSEAAEYGNAETVSLLLKTDSTLYSLKDNFGCTPLFLAATEGHEKVVKLLLDAGSDVNVTCRLHNLPWEPHFDDYVPLLGSTCIMGHQRIVQMIIEQPGVDINITGPMGMSPLALAAESGNAVIARLLLNKGADFNVLSREERRTPLSYAAESAHTEVLELLLQQSHIRINLADQNGRTPLSYAVERGDLDTVKLLLGAPGIRAHRADDRKRTPLSYAAESGNADAVGLLLEAPQSVEDRLTAGVDFKSHWGCTALYYGARSGQISVVERLLAAGAHPDATEHRYGETPLYCAAEMGSESLVRLLLSHGADPNVVIQPDTTALCCAIEKGFQNVIDALISNNADLNLPTPKTGRTPACMAASLGSESLLKNLATKGANMSTSSHSGWTPLCFASESCHVHAIETLIELGANIQAGPREQTPLLIAASNGNAPVVEFLLGKDFVTEDDLEAALFASARNGHISTITLLLGSLPIDSQTLDDHGATRFDRIVAEICKESSNVGLHLLSIGRERDDFNVNRKDRDGRTLIWWACVSKKRALISTLCADPCVDVNIADKDGIFPLFACLDKLLSNWGNEGFIEILEQLMTIESLNINARDSNGRTALMRAVRSIGSCSRAVVEILLSRNDIDVGLADHMGETALSCARSSRLGWPSGVVELLENYPNGM